MDNLATLLISVFIMGFGIGGLLGNNWKKLFDHGHGNSNSNNSRTYQRWPIISRENKSKYYVRYRKKAY